MIYLFNVPGYKPAFKFGGPIHSVAALAEGLVARGHSVFVATSNRNAKEVLDIDPRRLHDVNGVKVRYFETHPTCLQRTGIPYFAESQVFHFASCFKQWVTEHGAKIDIFHTHVSFMSSSPFFSRTAKKLNRVYLYHQRGMLDPEALKFRALKKRAYVQFIEKRVTRRADALIALTPYELTSYRFLGMRNECVVIPNGIDRDWSARASLMITAPLKSLLGTLNKRPLFLYLSRIHPTKGPDLYVGAFIEIAKRNQSLVGVLAGPDEFGMVQRLRSQIAAAQLDNRFHFLGPITGDDKVALLKRANVFVLPASCEGFSMAILEALACGCPVLTTAGSHFEAIETNGCGLIVGRSVPELSAGMERLLNKGESELKKMGENGQRLVDRHYSWPHVLNLYEALCYRLLENHYQASVAR